MSEPVTTPTLERWRLLARSYDGMDFDDENIGTAGVMLALGRALDEIERQRTVIAKRDTEIERLVETANRRWAALNKIRGLTITSDFSARQMQRIAGAALVSEGRE